MDQVLLFYEFFKFTNFLTSLYKVVIEPLNFEHSI